MGVIMKFEFRASCEGSFWTQTRILMKKNYEEIKGPKGSTRECIYNVIGMVWDIIDRPRSDAVASRLFLTIFRREMWRKWRNVVQWNLGWNGQNMCHLVFKVGQFGALVRLVGIWIIKWRVMSSALHPDIHLRVSSSDSTPFALSGD